jgi:SAM-dependent methyltransferase
MDTQTTSTLDEMLRGFRQDAGIHHISTSDRPFGGDAAGEEEYAAQFQVGDDYVENEVRGLLLMLDTVNADRSGPALEIGCGTGIFSRPLVNSDAYPGYLITDASLEFLRRTRAFVRKPLPGRLPVDESKVRYGLLGGEGMDLLPKGAFSMVALRYVLHHILHWEQFIGDAAKLLRPGGVLTFEEPCIDGFLLQALLVSFLPRLMEISAEEPPAGLRGRLQGVARAAGIVGRAPGAAAREQTFREQSRRFVEVIEFYARRDIDKAAAEDKHLFRPAEVMRVGRAHGLDVEFFPNSGYDTMATSTPTTDFEGEFFHNLRSNFGFGEPIVDLARRELAPQLALMRRIMEGGGGPYTKGVFACKRVH